MFLYKGYSSRGQVGDRLRTGSTRPPLQCKYIKDGWCTKNKKWCAQTVGCFVRQEWLGGSRNHEEEEVQKEKLELQEIRELETKGTSKEEPEETPVLRTHSVYR